jgi:MoaA/NifB/PqqE/SkfB family radical SAM enzyme
MLSKKIQLLRGLVNGETAFTGPFFVNVDITRRCNLACLGCQYHSSENRKELHNNYNIDQIPMDLVNKLCSDLIHLNTHEVFLLGQGEPLLHPQIAEIISAFKQIGCLVQLFTNGTLINESKARMLVGSGLDVIRVSLWATNEKEYKKCYPGINPENMQRTFEGIRSVHIMRKKQGRTHPQIFLTTPLNRHNWRSVTERVHLASDLGCDGVMFDVYQHWGEFKSDALSNHEISELCKRLSKLRVELRRLSLKQNIDEILLRYRLGERAWRSLPCYAGWFHTRVHVDGRILPCGACTLVLGNLNKNSLMNIWNGSAYRSFRKKMLNHRGSATFRSHCHCDWCCLGKSNFRIHRFFRWIHPVLKSQISPKNEV